ncbi:MAG: radical SAM family heme chaperone HemW [Candidatus Hydrogenedentota bacterium]
MLGVYVHIPYCRSLCPYCDFVKTRTDGSAPPGYVDALFQEMHATPLDQPVGSIFFGGGTPSLLTPDDLARLLGAFARLYALEAPEVTLEANPDDITPALVQAWRDAGVNRVSLGVQSFDSHVLGYLGRRHDAADALRACETVAAHCDNWNMDLIFGAQPVDTWGETLAQCRALAPPHVAAYGLTYEAGTPFGRRAHEALPDDAALALYQQAEAALGEYMHYEISNFARPGMEARHNLIYWHNAPYAGFGCAAYSYLAGVRARNHVDLAAYLAAPGEKCEAEHIGPAEERVETVIQYLRLQMGLSRDAYRHRFGSEVTEDFGPALTRLATRGLIMLDEEHVRPTAQGFYLNNEIGLELLDTFGDRPPMNSGTTSPAYTRLPFHS